MRRPLLVAAAALALSFALVFPRDTLVVPAWATLSTRIEQALAAMFDSAGNLTRLIFKTRATPPPLSKPGYCTFYVETATKLLMQSCDGGPYGSAAGVTGLSIASFGATSPGTRAANTAAMQAAIDAACESSVIKTVTIPGTGYLMGTVYVTGSNRNQLTSGTEMPGCTANGVPRSCCTGADAGQCDLPGYRCDGVTIKGEGRASHLLFDGEWSTSALPCADAGIVFHDVNNAGIADLLLEKGGTKLKCSASGYDGRSSREAVAGAYFENCTNCFVRTAKITNFVTGIRLRGNSTQRFDQMYGMQIEDVELTRNDYGILGENQSQYSIRHIYGSYSSSQQNGPHMIYLDNNDAGMFNTDGMIDGVYCGPMDGVGCNDTQYGGKCVQIRFTNRTTVRNVLASGCAGVLDVEDMRYGLLSDLTGIGLVSDNDTAIFRLVSMSYSKLANAFAEYGDVTYPTIPTPVWTPGGVFPSPTATVTPTFTAGGGVLTPTPTASRTPDADAYRGLGMGSTLSNGSGRWPEQNSLSNVTLIRRGATCDASASGWSISNCSDVQLVGTNITAEGFMIDKREVTQNDRPVFDFSTGSARCTDCTVRDVRAVFNSATRRRLFANSAGNDVFIDVTAPGGSSRQSAPTTGTRVGSQLFGFDAIPNTVPCATPGFGAVMTFDSGQWNCGGSGFFADVVVPSTAIPATPTATASATPSVTPTASVTPVPTFSATPTVTPTP